MRSDSEQQPIHHRPVLAALVALVACASCIGDEPEDAPLAEFRSAEFSASFQDGVAPTPAYAGTRDTMLEQNATRASSAFAARPS